MFKGLLLSASFLWRIPIKIGKITERDFERALIFFPVIGALEGIIIFFLSSLLAPYLPEDILALLLLLTLFLLRGIFHLDGLSDTFDALSYKGSGNPEEDRIKRLAIMKDSTVGVSGVTTIVVNLLLKFLLIKEILNQNNLSFLFLPFFLSRALLLIIIYSSQPARKDGLGFLMKKSLKPSGLALGLALSVFIWGVFVFSQQFLKIYHFLLILCMNLLISFYFKNKFEKAFLGLTGDNYGALVEIIEGVTLFYGAVLWERL